MKTMRPKLIGSASTLMELMNLMEKKLYWSNIQVCSDGYVSCSKGDLNKCFRVVHKSGRFRLEFTNY